MNYFELFNLQEIPIADKTVVAKMYFELQKKFHPDFYTNENEADRENALEQSAAVNEAYRIFQNPDKTIEYFLQVKGVITPDEKYQLPPDFLMEMMELNESFESMDETALQSQINDFETGLKTEVAPLLVPENAAGLTTEQMQQLKSYYYRRKYLKRILERLDD